MNCFNTWSGQKSAGGLGFTYYCPSSGFCGPYLSWIGTDALNSMNVGDFNPSTGTFTKLVTMGGGESSGLTNDDAAMVAQGATLYLTYVNWLGDLFVTWSSTPSNINSWATNDTLLPALYGATGTVASGNHMWITWTDRSGTLLDLGQFN